MIERHDRERFEVFGYALCDDDGSGVRRRLEKGFDRFVDIADSDPATAAAHIRADDIDILIDLKGNTQHARTQIPATRPAPLQVGFLVYPGTSGADYIDYMIADSIVAPFDQQPYFSERIVHLPGCYQPNDRQRPIASPGPSRVDCNLPEGSFVFCCFNNNFKIVPAIFDRWMRLLRAVPNSVLWLIATNRFVVENLRREAIARGVAAERLVFAPPIPLPEHLARHRHADLFLDTLPYNAHTTASDALWAGLPVLTCRGATFAGRVAASLLHAVGLPELVTDSLDHYERLAFELATDAARLAAMRHRLLVNRRTAPLFDGGAFASGLEAAYEIMWRRHRQGLPPAAFSVSSDLGKSAYPGIGPRLM
jgi:predicted O-linked N-acetylglucosamine transferase (SPINDLY family)